MKVLLEKSFLDDLFLINCGVLFQKNLPITLAQNLLRLVQTKGMINCLDDALRVLQLCSSDTSETGILY